MSASTVAARVIMPATADKEEDQGHLAEMAEMAEQTEEIKIEEGGAAEAGLAQDPVAETTREDEEGPEATADQEIERTLERAEIVVTEAVTTTPEMTEIAGIKVVAEITIEEETITTIAEETEEEAIQEIGMATTEADHPRSSSTGPRETTGTTPRTWTEAHHEAEMWSEPAKTRTTRRSAETTATLQETIEMPTKPMRMATTSTKIIKILKPTNSTTKIQRINRREQLMTRMVARAVILTTRRTPTPTTTRTRKEAKLETPVKAKRRTPTLQTATTLQKWTKSFKMPHELLLGHPREPTNDRLSTISGIFEINGNTYLSIES